MVTLVYICNSCKGNIEARTFEIEYKDISAAESAPLPRCPNCGGEKSVTRFFGHNIFCPSKSNRSPLPARFAPIEDQPRKTIVSVGMRVDENEKGSVGEAIEELLGGGQIEKIEDPDCDVPEEKLGLKKGTLDRALFDIRQKQMIRELVCGKKISGFFLPVTGDTDN